MKSVEYLIRKIAVDKVNNHVWLQQVKNQIYYQVADITFLEVQIYLQVWKDIK